MYHEIHAESIGVGIFTPTPGIWLKGPRKSSCHKKANSTSSSRVANCVTSSSYSVGDLDA